MYAFVDAAKVSLSSCKNSSFVLLSITGCKKDHTRTDYRKAEKMRPGIWYLILAFGYLLISI